MLLLVGPSPERSGGIATWIRLARRGLTARGLRVSLFPTDKRGGGRGSLGERLVDGAELAARFAATVRAERPRVAHICCGSGWGLREAGVLAGLARSAGAGVVLHLHAASLEERMADSTWEERSSLAALAMADRVAVLGESAARALQAAGVAAPVQIVPNGVPLGEAAPMPSGDRLRLLLLGSVEERKGVSVLRETVGRLTPAERDRLAIRWCGPVRVGPAEEARARAVLELVGPVPPEAIPGELAGCHGLLLPSLREGLPFAVLEAMAAGRPVIASRVGALGELVRGGGVLVPPGDAGALAEALSGWLADRERLPELGMEARRDVARGHTLSHTVDALLELWSPWLGER